MVEPAAQGSEPQPTGRRVAKGAAWRFVEALGGEGLSLLVFVVMARLLVPADFGVVALAGVLIAACQVMVTSALPDAVVQGETLTGQRLATAFWGNLGLGTALLLLVVVVARPLAGFFGEPALAPVLMALAPILPVTAAASILQARFVRQLGFKTVTQRVLLGTTMGGLVGLGFAASGAGVWALVAQQLTSMTTGLVVLVLADPWRPKFVVDRREAIALARFSLPLLGTHLTRFAGKKLDLALLGLFLPAAAVGHYFLATRVIFALGMATYYSVATLTLPVLARLRHQPAALIEATVRTLWLTAALCLPAGLGVALLAGPMVELAVGAAWAPSVLPLQLLAAFSIFYALALITGQVLVAADRPALYFRLTVTNTTVFLLMVAVAAPFGLAVVALAGGLANALFAPVHLLALRRTIGLALASLARDQLPIWLAAGLMCAAVLLIDGGVGHALAVHWRLGLGVLTGVVVYVSALALFAAGTLASILATLGLGRGCSTGAAAEAR
jgi:PST family polysaccharide transporter